MIRAILKHKPFGELGSVFFYKNPWILINSSPILCTGAAFVLLGPLPFLNLKKTMGTIIAGLVLHGLGLGAEVVAGFADAHKSALMSVSLRRLLVVTLT